MVTPCDRGAHQRRTSSGRVNASKTIRAGPLNVRVITTSRSDTRSIVVGFTVVDSFFPAAIRLLLVFELIDELVQFPEARIPELPIALEPVVEAAERFP